MATRDSISEHELCKTFVTQRMVPLHCNKQYSDVEVVSRDSIRAHQLVQNIDYAMNGAHTLL